MGSFEILLQRNLNFIKGQSQSFDFVALRSSTSKTQSPHTIIVTCSDSRVSPEYIFQCGIGELFVVRTAGDILDSVGIESVEFAVENLNVQQIILMGHTNCGAIISTVLNLDSNLKKSVIFDEVAPLVYEAKNKGIVDKEKIVEISTRNNLYKQLNKLLDRTSISSKLQNNQLKIYLGIYDLFSGKFELIEEFPK